MSSDTKTEIDASKEITSEEDFFTPPLMTDVSHNPKEKAITVLN
jgi:hypothetical protein